MTTLISKHPIPNRISPARRNLQSNAAKHQLKGKPSSEGPSSQISAGSDPSGASHRLHNLLIKSHLQNFLFHKTSREPAAQNGDAQFTSRVFSGHPQKVDRTNQRRKPPH